MQANPPPKNRRQANYSSGHFDRTRAPVPGHPITPSQYDESIYLLAQAKWFSNHPGARDNVPNAQIAMSLEQLALSRLEAPKSSIIEEGRDRKNWVRAPG